MTNIIGFKNLYIQYHKQEEPKIWQQNKPLTII